MTDVSDHVGRETRPVALVDESDLPGESGIAWLRWTGFVAGPIAAVVVFYALEGVVAPGGETLTRDGRAALAAAVLMAVWWLSEALPIEATALVPIALFPLLGIGNIQAATRPYANEVIYLFLGGMILGLAMEKWGLHRRVALHVMARVGTRPSMLILGVMAVTAFISMWVSNTAAAVMMLPIGMSIVRVVEQGGGGGKSSEGRGSAFATALMLGVAYAATIGGVGTLIGTPPNAVLAGFLKKQYGTEFSFADWLWIGIPTAVIFLPLTWLVLTRVAFKVGHEPQPAVAGMIRSELTGLGRMVRGEKLTLMVFGMASMAWIFRVQIARATGLEETLPNGTKEALLSDAGIAIIAAVLLFLLPVRASRGEFVLNWRDVKRLPWGVLLLFGGGLALADVLTRHNVDDFVGACLAGLRGVHPLVLVLVMTTITVFATEIGSNTAIATTFLPVAAAAAASLGVHPYLLAFPVAIGCSYAFMMPMGTPPNSLVFASGRVNIRQMARAGLVLNVLSIVVITVLVYFAGPWLLDMEAPPGR